MEAGNPDVIGTVIRWFVPSEEVENAYATESVGAGRRPCRLGVRIPRNVRSYGGMKGEEMRKLKELERENTRLKKIVADQALDIDMLKELSEGNL